MLCGDPIPARRREEEKVWPARRSRSWRGRKWTYWATTPPRAERARGYEDCRSREELLLEGMLEPRLRAVAVMIPAPMNVKTWTARVGFARGLLAAY